MQQKQRKVGTKSGAIAKVAKSAKSAQQSSTQPNTPSGSAPQSPKIGEKTERVFAEQNTNFGKTPHSPKLGARKSGASVPKGGGRLIRKLELSKTATKSPKTPAPGNSEPDPNATTVQSDGFSPAFHGFFARGFNNYVVFQVRPSYTSGLRPPAPTSRGAPRKVSGIAR